ncbi:MAG: PEGA domain-containing protein [Deltaproteobacteria bacterium]|nr:PEGA domain-containing protein [Deltaproteobacteria bacterium]
MVAWAALVVVAGGASHAAEPTDEDKKKAGEYYKEGQELFRKELYSAAIQAFEKAHKLVAHPANLYNIARSYEKLGDADNCVKRYDEYVDFYKRQNNGQDPKDIVDVRASVAKCRLLQRPRISIGSEPDGAKVYIDDKEKLLGQTPYETTLDPGRYKIMLDLDGYVPFEETFEVRAGEPVNLRFRLEKFQRVGKIRVKANVRGASIFLDGRNIGLTPYTDPITVDEGPHQISVKKDEYTDFNKEVKVVVNEQVDLTAEVFLRDSPMTWKGYVGWSALVLGVGLGVGGFFAGQEAEKYFNDTDDFDTWSGYQKLGYGLGGGLVGAGIGLLIWEATDTSLVRSEDELDPYAGSPRITPLVGAAPSPTGGARGVMVGADVRF